VVKHKKVNNAKGSETHNKYGLALPHLVLVLSKMTPMIGSKIASKTLTTKNKVAITAG
jgi:hypothetical protein